MFTLIYRRLFLVASTIVAFNAVCLISTSNAQDITGSGNIVSQERNVDAFTGIQFATVGDVFVREDTEHSLLIEADDNIIDLLTTEVNEELLTIGLESGVTIDNSDISVYASMVDIERLEITGVGNIESTEPINANDILCRISGVGDIELSGTAVNQTVEIIGSGSVRNFDLISTNSSVSITGTGNCEVNVSGDLDAVINGVGNVVYIGNPSNVDAEINGIGTVTEGTPDDNNNIERAQIGGEITYQGSPLCAMALANGQYIFTCGDSLGVYDLNVPLDENGEITLYGFCSGFSPFKAVLSPTQAQNYDINMIRAPAGSRTIQVTMQTESGITNPERIRVSGTVYFDTTPLCGMILANGQSMFSCGANLGTFDLEVPLDADGEITFYAFCSGFAPYKEVFMP